MPVLPSASAQKIQFSWLLRLRWVAITGQLLLFLAVELGLGLPLPWLPLVLIVGLEAATNGLAAWLAGRRTPTEIWLVALLALDVFLLTALLYFTGGPLNPFSFLYMVHVTLAATTLRPRLAWLPALLSLAGFGALFVLPSWSGHPEWEMEHAAHWSLHLYGMYVAFGVSSVLVVYFVARVQQALAEREAELAAAKDLAERQARFASLATMAAGAAHELGTPLSTIAVVAKELERQAAQDGEDWAEDVRLIRAQVRRCQEILQQMALDAGSGVGEAARSVTAAELLAEIRTANWGGTHVRSVLQPAIGQRVLRVPVNALNRALRNLVKNAVQASPPGATVEVALVERNGELCVEVRDRGKGMAPEVLARAGEPFFTTKSPGEGIGLGLFLVRLTLEQMGGRLEIDSAPGKGTVARMVLPSAVAGATDVDPRERSDAEVCKEESGAARNAKRGMGISR